MMYIFKKIHFPVVASYCLQQIRSKVVKTSFWITKKCIFVQEKGIFKLLYYSRCFIIMFYDQVYRHKHIILDAIFLTCKLYYHLASWHHTICWMNILKAYQLFYEPFFHFWPIFDPMLSSILGYIGYFGWTYWSRCMMTKFYDNIIQLFDQFLTPCTKIYPQ